MQGAQGRGSFAYDSFIRVNPRKRKEREHAPTASALLTRAKEELVGDGGWSRICREIFHEALHDVKARSVLCLGLGSPSSSRDARAQLALLSDLCASSDIDAADVSVYDPVFTDADRELIQSLGMRCLDPIQGVEHSLACPTVLYMPHCDLQLYETVVRANWALDRLCNAVFLANRFSDYVDSNTACRLERVAPCLARLAPLVVGRALPRSDTFPSAFSSLSVQYVNRTPLSLQGSAFWDLPASE